DLRVTAPGLPPGRVANVVVEETGSDQPVLVTLGRGGTIELRVEGPTGRGVTGARVWLETAERLALHARPFTTAPGGRLTLQGVPAGAVFLRVYAPRYGRPDRIPVRVDEDVTTPVNVSLRWSNGDAPSDAFVSSRRGGPSRGRGSSPSTTLRAVRTCCVSTRGLPSRRWKS
ncbi:MAG: carboxypeptidase-like regulatory domain-containing protein, partial [Planctomycetota bacterium]